MTDDVTPPDERHDADRVRVGLMAYDIAQRVGCRARTAHFWLHDPARRLQRIVAAVIYAHIAARKLPELNLWDAEIREAYEQGQPLPMSGDLILAAQEADLGEEQAETRYILNPSAETAREWYRAIQRETARQQQAGAALAAQWGFQP